MQRDRMTADEIAAGIAAVAPECQVRLDAAALASRSRDWWPVARLREVSGQVLPTAAALAQPRSTDEVSAILHWANAAGVTVIPRGLGSGVCGAVMPSPESLLLELSDMTRILHVDLVSHVVHVEAGIRGDVLERQLNEIGLTLGHYPQSMNISTVGGWLAAWSSGQASPGYGSIEHRLLGLTYVLADGTVVDLPAQPRPAVGPDLRRLVVGAEGTFAVVTRAWLACAPLDPEIIWTAVTYPSFADCLGAARTLRRAGLGERVLRGWDEEDTVRVFGERGQVSGAFGLVGIPASAAGVDARIQCAERIAKSFGATPIDPGLGAHWWAHRLDAVDSFESILGPQRTLGPGTMIDTLEVTALWANIESVYASVRNAFAENGVAATAHFSHVYSSGVALYFTFLPRDTDDEAVQRRHAAAWAAALEACAAAGGSASHHHGLGRAKASTLGREIGDGGLEVLRRLKTALDPQKTLNPGVLSG